MSRRRATNDTTHGKRGVEISIASVLVALERCDGNQRRLATQSGIQRTSIINTLKGRSALNVTSLAALASGVGLTVSQLVSYAERRVAQVHKARQS